MTRKEHGIMKKAMEILKKEFVKRAPADGIGKGMVTIQTFGTFTVRRAASRKARNPATGEIVIIPDRTVVRFAMSKALLDALN